MRKAFAALVIPVLLLVGAGCQKAAITGNADTSAPGYVAPAATGPGTAANVNAAANVPRSVSMALKTIGTSGQSGTVTLTALSGSQTRVDIVLSASNKERLIAGVYPGTCKTMKGEAQRALNAVINGKSTTTIDANIDGVIGEIAQSIAIKRDVLNAQEPFAACADLH